MRRPFVQVDVFTDAPFAGNPLAVVLDATGLSASDMARIANWTNLSETVFLSPPTHPDADYRVRIFTPAEELPFAGHPTLGSAHAWLTAGDGVGHVGEVVQECGVGLVTLRRDGARLAFAAPPLLRSGPIDEDDRRIALDVLGVDETDVVDCAWVDNGPGWMGFLLRHADDVLRIAPGSTNGRDLKIGVIAPQSSGAPTDVEVRAFFSVGDELREDPVTGSLNASLAQWLLGTGALAAPYTATQGTAIGRAGTVYLDESGSDVWVGGQTITVVAGTIDT